MPRTCSICSHPARPAITGLLIRRAPYRKISERFSVSEAALSRHLNEHLATHVQKALTAYDDKEGVRVLDKLCNIIDRLDAFLDQAEADVNGPEFRATAAEVRRQLELVAKLQGELDERPQVNILVTPQWISIRSAMMNALSAYPEARIAVAAALLELEGSTNGSG
jgi:hypothetical protein